MFFYQEVCVIIIDLILEVKAIIMGNCLRPDERDRNSDEFEPIPTLQTSVKHNWFRLLRVQNILYFESNYLNKKYEHPSFVQIDKDIDRTYPNQAEFHIE